MGTQQLDKIKRGMEKISKYTGLKIFIFMVFLCGCMAVSVSAQQPGQRVENSKKAIVKAEDFYNKAVLSYEKGEIEQAEKYYVKAMQQLSLANIDADINYKLKEEFDNLFTKIDIIFQAINGAPQTPLDVAEEDLKSVVEATATVKKPVIEEEANRKYSIPINPDDELVQRYLTLYSGKWKNTIQEAFQRSGMYREMILGILKENELPQELVYLPMVESLYKNNAYSRARAVGLWQLMPKTARNLGLTVNYWIDERRDPEKATRAAVKYLKELHEWFNDWHLALAAYNRGEAGIGRDLNYSKATDFKGLQNMNAIPGETNHFVPNFMACTIIGDNLKEYGFNPDFQKPIKYDEVALDKAVDLEVVAKCVNATPDEIKKLNPTLVAWCTPKNCPGFRLKLPEGTTNMFLTNLANVKDVTPTRGFVFHTVKRGEVLSNIAKIFHTTAYEIKRNNNISNVNKIRVGSKLKIQPGRGYYSAKNKEKES